MNIYIFNNDFKKENKEREEKKLIIANNTNI